MLVGEDGDTGLSYTKIVPGTVTLRKSTYTYKQEHV